MTTTRERATGRDVVLAIRDNMLQSLEPLVTETVAPSLYQVYLHGDDYEHLRSLFPKLEAEAEKILQEELEKLNKAAIPLAQRAQRLIRRKETAQPTMRYVNAEGRWSVRFQEDPNGVLEPGDIEVVSEFAQPPSAGFVAGSKTRRISTTRRLGQSGDATIARREEAPAWARITFTDNRGAQTYFMTKDEIVIGREAGDAYVWVDLRLDTFPDVSREHARLQRTPAGTFRIKDLSKLGTTVNGTPLPPSLQVVEGEAKDMDRWVDLPDRARIALAGVISLEFERTGS
ncbi:MAG TPA: FHA domain-containing protein [Thermoanaerobaculia bacterium]|nr:FHA domain-containing protein [Thermoanaerobaculia bacterium]